MRQRGELPSTREIAEAAGIAEGTLFRAFPTKEELLEEVIAATFCPAPLLRQLDGIDVTLPLRPRLVAVVSALQQRLFDVFELMVGLRLSAPPRGRVGEHRACTAGSGHVPGPGSGPEGKPAAGRRHAAASGPDHPPGSSHDCATDPGQPDDDRASARIAALVEPDAQLLSCTPLELARYLRLLTFSGSHRQLTHGHLLSPETIVAVVLDGVLERQPASGRPANGIPTSQPPREPGPSRGP